jgi:hypothetical protein
MSDGPYDTPTVNAYVVGVSITGEDPQLPEPPEGEETEEPAAAAPPQPDTEG